MEIFPLYTVSEKQILKYQMPFSKEKKVNIQISVSIHRKRSGKAPGN